jgi:ABC-2 type transport system permease protein
VKTLAAMMQRDLLVLRRSLAALVVRVTVQPVLFLFVFGYVFPRIGFTVGGEAHGEEFNGYIVTGTIGVTAVLQGIPAVGMPLITDLAFTREIEDRAMAPAPIWLLPLQKTLAGAVECVLAALVVVPLALTLPAGAVPISIHWPLFALTLVVGAILGACLGLAIGTNFSAERLPWIYTLIAIPMTFLGAAWYPWSRLDAIPWLQTLLLLNPLVYVNESMRAALLQGGIHMSVAVALALALTAAGLLFIAGARGLGVRLRGD